MMDDNRAQLLFVTFEYKPFLGGIATYTYEMIRASPADSNVSVLAPDYGCSDTKDNEFRLLRHHSLSVRGLISALVWIGSRPATELIVAVDIRSVILSWLARLILGRSYIAIAHGSEVQKLTGRGPARFIARMAYRGACKIRANSQYTLGSIMRSLGSHRDARVALLGVSERWFVTPPSCFSSAILRSFSADAVMCCSVGRLEERKGHLDAIQIVKKAREISGINIFYVISGKGFDDAYQDTLLSVVGENDFCIYAGALCDDDVRLLYARSAAHILCAQVVDEKIEGFGLVVVEAAAQGCPTIASRVGGIVDAIGEGAGGTLHDGKAIEEMAKRLAELARNQTLRAEQGELAQLRARTLTWSACWQGTFGDSLEG